MSKIKMVACLKRDTCNMNGCTVDKLRGFLVHMPSGGDSLGSNLVKSS